MVITRQKINGEDRKFLLPYDKRLISKIRYSFMENTIFPSFTSEDGISFNILKMGQCVLREKQPLIVATVFIRVWKGGSNG